MVRKSMLYISKNYSSNITLEDVASQVHLNPAYFSTLFKQASGSSFKEYLNLVRVEEGKNCLQILIIQLLILPLLLDLRVKVIFQKYLKSIPV